MNRFHVGQEVVCINDKGNHSWRNHRPLKVGNKYTVTALWDCCEPSISVGIPSFAGATSCQRCGNSIQDGMWYFYESRFAPVQEEKEQFKAVTFTKIQENVPAQSEN